MVFYFYEEAMEPVRKIAVDGLVPNSFHLSSRVGNKTPRPYKADTATESALKFIADPKGPSFFPYANIITNDHFDTDGLLAAFTLLHPKQAEPMARLLTSAAESGAFSSFSSEAGVQMDLLLMGLVTDQSPLFPSWKRSSGPQEALYYKAVLPLLPDLFHRQDKYQALWRKPFDDILTSMTLFERGLVGFEEYSADGLSVIIDEVLPARHAIDMHCKGDLFLIVEDYRRHGGGYRYQLLYRYPVWAETLRRPILPRIAMEELADDLNRQEAAASQKQAAPLMQWRTKGPGMPPTGALIFSDPKGQCGLSSLEPDGVIQSVLSHIRKIKEEDSSGRHSENRVERVREARQPFVGGGRNDQTASAVSTPVVGRSGSPSRNASSRRSPGYRRNPSGRGGPPRKPR